ncbi:Transcriptional activator, Rgg/GadR/MutR family, partial [human gut metagenome]
RSWKYPHRCERIYSSSSWTLKKSEQQLIDPLQEQSDNPDFIEAFYLEKQALYQKSRKKEDRIESIIVKGFLCALKDGITASTEESNFLHNYLFSVDIFKIC